MSLRPDHFSAGTVQFVSFSALLDPTGPDEVSSAAMWTQPLTPDAKLKLKIR